ncbi:uncharacterized protein PG998_010829 [Apiospora kogelbergensis]|uniref:uncharacterized protein n=1 Tax=Apiospora kogelbergensis TaxID=1337665 RepID=UPI00312F93E6
MAPIRRYLRITKYSVIECRIYLDNPALAQTWLLNPRKPVLPRVIESVRPLVLPKLREEKERSRKKSTKKKGIKDVVVEDDFEVSIFLTETTTRHSLVTKHKHFHDTTQTKLTSNSGRLVGATHEAPLDVDLHAASGAITIRREESDNDEGLLLDAIPLAPASVTGSAAATSSRPKRARRNTAEAEAEDEQQHGGESDFEVIPSSDDEDGDDAYDEGGLARSAASGQPPAKRRKEAAAADENNTAADGDDKKKLAMDISYEGFSIYGRVLCLVVKRRDQSNATASGGGGAISKGKQGGGSAMMENFIISTQVPAGAEAEAGGTS